MSDPHPISAAVSHLEEGRDEVSRLLRNALRRRPKEPIVIQELVDLRAEYTLEIIELNRIEIEKLDASHKMTEALADLGQATSGLKEIQDEAKAGTKSLTEVADVLEKVKSAIDTVTGLL